MAQTTSDPNLAGYKSTGYSAHKEIATSSSSSSDESNTRAKVPLSPLLTNLILPTSNDADGITIRKPKSRVRRKSSKTIELAANTSNTGENMRIFADVSTPPSNGEIGRATSRGRISLTRVKDPNGSPVSHDAGNENYLSAESPDHVLRMCSSTELTARQGLAEDFVDEDDGMSCCSIDEEPPEAQHIRQVDSEESSPLILDSDLETVPIGAEVAHDPEKPIATIQAKEENKRDHSFQESSEKEHCEQFSNIMQMNVLGKSGVGCSRSFVFLSLFALILGVMTAVMLAENKQPPPENASPIRPVKAPPAGMYDDENDFEFSVDWKQYGEDLLGGDLAGGFGRFVVLSSDGSRMAVTSANVETKGVSLFEIGDDEGFTSLYHGFNSEISFEYDTPFFSTISGNGNYFIVALGTGDAAHRIVFYDIPGGLVTDRTPLFVNGLYDGYYGEPIATSDSADFVAVGIDGWQIGSNNRVQVHEYVGDSWEQVGSDITSNSNEFGSTVCLSSDGSILAVASRATFRVYERSSGDWVQMGTTPTSNDHGVERIVMSADGKTVAVSGGGVRVYGFQGQEWVQLGDVITADSDYKYYNLDRVALSADGLTLATGTDNGDSADEWDDVIGYVRVYKLIEGSWKQIGERIDGAASREAFGGSISLSEDGSRLAIGAPGNVGSSSKVGLVRVYNLA